MDDEIRILYRDEHVVAVFKPPGMLVHRTVLDADNQEAALQITRDLVGGRVYPIHRLDKPTGGVLLFGLTSEAASGIGRALSSREVSKEYLALVRGWPPARQTIDHPLGPTRDHRRMRRPSAETTGPKPGADLSSVRYPQDARTSYALERRFEVPEPTGRYASTRSSLVRLVPHTGRTHQIRRHMKHVFHPVIGDRKYGDDAHNRFYARRFGGDELMLASVMIRFEHPFTRSPVSIEAQPGKVFRNLLGDLLPFESFPDDPVADTHDSRRPSDHPFP